MEEMVAATSSNLENPRASLFKLFGFRKRRRGTLGTSDRSKAFDKPSSICTRETLVSANSIRSLNTSSHRNRRRAHFASQAPTGCPSSYTLDEIKFDEVWWPSDDLRKRDELDTAAGSTKRHALVYLHECRDVCYAIREKINTLILHEQNSLMNSASTTEELGSSGKNWDHAVESANAVSCASSTASSMADSVTVQDLMSNGSTYMPLLTSEELAEQFLTKKLLLGVSRGYRGLEANPHLLSDRVARSEALVFAVVAAQEKRGSLLRRKNQRLATNLATVSQHHSQTDRYWAHLLALADEKSVLDDSGRELEVR